MSIYNGKKTEQLLEEIMLEKSFEHFVEQNEENFVKKDFPEYLNELCRKKNMIPGQVIRAAQIDRTYGHSFFSGTRKPSRDKAIQLAFGFGLTVEETQEFLRMADRNELYPRIKRDAAFIFGLTRHLSVLEMQELLAAMDIPILGE